MATHSFQMARPPIKPLAPFWQATRTCRSNISKSTPALSSAHGTLLASLTAAQASAHERGSVSKVTSTGNSSFRMSGPRRLRRAAVSRTRRGRCRAKPALDFGTAASRL